MESCECAFVSKWVLLSPGCELIITAYLSRPQGLIYPSLALSHGVLQTSSSHLIVFCRLLFLCVTKAEKKDMSSNAGTHFRRGLNEGHLLSCWAHAKHRSLICSLLKTKASKLMMSVWKSGGVVLKFGLSSDEHLMSAGQLWFESHPRVCSRATSLLVGPLWVQAQNVSPTYWPCHPLRPAGRWRPFTHRDTWTHWSPNDRL